MFKCEFFIRMMYGAWLQGLALKSQDFLLKNNQVLWNTKRCSIRIESLVCCETFVCGGRHFFASDRTSDRGCTWTSWSSGRWSVPDLHEGNKLEVGGIFRNKIDSQSFFNVPPWYRKSYSTFHAAPNLKKWWKMFILLFYLF